MGIGGMEGKQGHHLVIADASQGVSAEVINAYETTAKELGLPAPRLLVDLNDRGTGGYTINRQAGEPPEIIMNQTLAQATAGEQRYQLTWALNSVSAHEPLITQSGVRLMDAHYAKSVSRELRSPEEKALVESNRGNHPTGATTETLQLNAREISVEKNLAQMVNRYDEMQPPTGQAVPIYVNLNDQGDARIFHVEVNGKDSVIVNLAAVNEDGKVSTAAMANELNMIKSKQLALAQLAGTSLSGVQHDATHDGKTVQMPAAISGQQSANKTQAPGRL